MRLRGAACAAIAVVSAASAQTLSLEGMWGNEAGCRYARTGDIEGDEHLLLTTERLESYGTGCTWVEVLTAKGGEQVATGSCGYEGEASLGVERFIIVRDAADFGLIRVLAANGEVWGEGLRKCP